MHTAQSMHPNLSFHHDFPPKADSWYGRFEDNVPGSLEDLLVFCDILGNLGRDVGDLGLEIKVGMASRKGLHLRHLEFVYLMFTICSDIQ